MSLVNDMLRDLNKRTPVSNHAARVHGAFNSSVDSKRPKVRVGLILAGGLLAGLLAGYFYFQTMGVQVVQVPLAVVPSAPTQPLPQTPPAVQTPATVTADTPAVENVVELRELALQPNGFTLLIEASEATRYEIRDRSAFGLTLHVEGVDRYDRSGTAVPGMSLLLVSDGLDIGIELDREADFLVREDSETAGFDILLTVSYRAEEVTAVDTTPPQTAAAPPPTPAAAQAQSTAPPRQAANNSATTSAAPVVRVARELSLEDRDRNNRQSALMLVQSGRLAEAYGQLLRFLEDNPAAHESRETLAKLLLAQQEYVQAGLIVDAGLAQVPNYAAFKKIKARLLMQNNDPAQALTLLRNVAPDVGSDTEYHELLASLYQQGNYHPQAVSAYQALLRVDRQQGRWWVGLGISLEAQGMDSDALASYQAALQTTNLDAGLRQFIQARIDNLGAPQ